MSEELEQYELVEEPSGPCEAVIREVATRRRNGEPLVSKFGNRKQALVVSRTESGFEVRDYFDLPDDQYIRRGRLYDLISSLGIQRLNDLKDKTVRVGPVKLRNGGVRWRILLGGEEVASSNPKCAPRPKPASKQGQKAPAGR